MTKTPDIVRLKAELVPGHEGIAAARANELGLTDVLITPMPRAPGTLVQASRVADGGLTAEAARSAMTTLTALLRTSFDVGAVRTGEVDRIGAGIDALADVAIAHRGTVAVVATTSEIIDAFGSVEPLAAAFTEHRVHDERHFFARHLDAGSNAAWFRACFADQWRLAWRAKPGTTFYGVSMPEECADLLAFDRTHLRQVGYRDGHVEVAAFLPADATIAPAEVLAWSNVLRSGKLGDGSPVSHVRIVFRDEAMARRAATPLLDIGAEVAFMSRSGDYVSL